MFEDLRGFLTHLESHKQLLRVKDAVDVKYEIAAGMRKTSDIDLSWARESSSSALKAVSEKLTLTR